MLEQAIAAARALDAALWFVRPDLGNVFQDAAGTTPVTAAGQPVGLLLDQQYGTILTAGPGYHLSQATAAKRPVLAVVGGEYCLVFDGNDDEMASTHSVQPTAEAMVMAYDRTSTGTGDSLMSHGPSGFASGCRLNIQANNSARVQLSSGNVVIGTEDGTQQVWSAVISSGSQSSRWGGVENATGVLTYTGFAGPVNVGRSTAGADYTAMNVFLASSIPSSPTLSQLRAIERYGASLAGAPFA